MTRADLQVIGCGFGRTGTDSMRAALDMLGVGPCHHMTALIGDAAHRESWRAFVHGGPCDWDVLLGGWRSCVDWPTAHYWRELTALFPAAKVLLTWRSAESWWASFERTILPLVIADTEKGEGKPGPQVVRQSFGGQPLTRAHCIAVYEANVAAVRAEVPADRLLVHEIGDGWEPLCAHLSVPVPDAPFPHVNTTADFIDRTGERAGE